MNRTYHTAECDAFGDIIEIDNQEYRTANDARAALATWVPVSETLWMARELDGTVRHACIVEFD